MYCSWYSDITLNNGLKFPQYKFYVLKTYSWNICYFLLFPVTLKLNDIHNSDAGFCINSYILMLNNLNY